MIEWLETGENVKQAFPRVLHVFVEKLENLISHETKKKILYGIWYLIVT